MAITLPADAPDRAKARDATTGSVVREMVARAAPIPERSAEVRQPVVDAVVRNIQTHERVRALTREQFDATLSYDTARTQYNREAYVAQIEYVRARGEFVSAMTHVYRDPAEAVRRFEADAKTRSSQSAVEALTTVPEVYGTLRTAEPKGWIARFQKGDETPARLAAHEAAVRAITVEHRRGDALDVPRARGTFHEARQRVETAEMELRGLPSTAHLERDIRTRLRDVTPVERGAIAAQLTDAQRAFMQSLGSMAQHTAKDIALGRESRER